MHKPFPARFVPLLLDGLLHYPHKALTVPVFEKDKEQTQKMKNPKSE